MEDRPKIKIKQTRIDYVIEALGIFLLALLWFVAIWHYPDLPETIPVHYNLAGEADGFGEKKNIFLLPIIGTVQYVVISFLQEYPHLFNYWGKISPENAKKQYTNAVRTIACLKCAMILLFLVINYQTVRVAMGKTEGLGTWFSPVGIGLILLLVGYSLVQSYRLKKQK